MTCWVHTTKKALAHGHFLEPKRRWAFARMTYSDGEEVDAQIHRRALHAHQKRQWTDLRGRYFAIARSGTVHLCTCRWTQEKIDAMRVEANKLFVGLRVE